MHFIDHNSLSHISLVYFKNAIGLHILSLSDDNINIFKVIQLIFSCEIDDEMGDGWLSPFYNQGNQGIEMTHVGTNS